jgi:hypothetical protein
MVNPINFYHVRSYLILWLFKVDRFKNWRPTYPWLEWCHFRSWQVSSFFTLVFDHFLIARQFFTNIRMFLFRAFDTYIIKMLGGHPKDKREKLKHHTIFCVQQQPPDNTCSFYICLNMIAFGVQPNWGVSVNIFILLYCWLLWLNMHIHLLLIHTSHFIVAGLRKCFH